MLAAPISATAHPAGAAAVVEHALDTHHQMDNLGDNAAAQGICVGTTLQLAVALAQLIVITGYKLKMAHPLDIQIHTANGGRCHNDREKNNG